MQAGPLKRHMPHAPVLHTLEGATIASVRPTHGADQSARHGLGNRPAYQLAITLFFYLCYDLLGVVGNGQGAMGDKGLWVRMMVFFLLGV